MSSIKEVICICCSCSPQRHIQNRPLAKSARVVTAEAPDPY